VKIFKALTGHTNFYTGVTSLIPKALFFPAGIGPRNYFQMMV